jgi:hypothetical protein
MRYEASISSRIAFVKTRLAPTLPRAFVATAVIVALAVAVLAYASIPIGWPFWTCPLIRTGPAYPGTAGSPFTIATVGDLGGAYSGTGTVRWCIYSSGGLLVGSHLTDRRLNGWVPSADGSVVAVLGNKVSGGAGTFVYGGGLYLFNKNGQMEWSITSPQSIDSVEMNGNGSVIVAGGSSELLYIDSAGGVLWNYSQNGPAAIALLDEGSSVLAAVSQITIPGHTNFGSALIMFDSRGNQLWNVTIPDQIVVSGSALAVSGGHITFGVSYDGYNGTVAYYDTQGNLVWSRHVDSAILGLSFEGGGSIILATTNWGQVTFDLSGDVIANQTAAH